ncbi:uncharacterized protein LOC118647375 [Monomorium pharaonis]|uniref:uncharacterized protein LOC118647375 n=1 Tax=Monomorium pharaonis TaxID=307658 RepID=UPI0017469A07|nr:uncharacterized protein LOC118647375 [Monomorium pharaonis]
MFNLSSNFHEESKIKRKRKGWRLFHAKDFLSLMYPCFTICNIIGIFPYKINASTFEISKPRYILLAVVICVCDIYALIVFYGFPIFKKIDMITLPGSLKVDCVIGFGCFIMTVTFILCSPQMRLLQIILNISSRLPQESYQKLSKLIHAKDIIGSFYLIWLLLTCVVIYGMHCFFVVYVTLVIFQMDMVYMNCVYVLKACFKRINDNLVNMNELTTNYNLNGSGLIYYDHKYPFLIIKLKALKKEHLIISNTVQMLNLIYSLQLLGTVILTFVDVTINVYYYILEWKPNYNLFTNTFIELRILYYMFQLSTITFNFIKIVLIVWACETGKNEALQINTSIHDMFNSVTDDQVKEEVV